MDKITKCKASLIRLAVSYILVDGRTGAPGARRLDRGVLSYVCVGILVVRIDVSNFVYQKDILAR